MQVSIIIPSFNTKGLLKKCLASIFKETHKVKFEVIVVDNASSDGSVEMVRKEFPKVELIELDNNCGYGRANNLGVRQAKGDWLLLLNSDTKIVEGAIDGIFRAISQGKFPVDDPVVGCKLVYPDHSFQQSAGYFPTLGRVIAMMLFLDDLPVLGQLFKSYQQSRPGFYRAGHEVDWVTGAFLLVKRKLFNSAGGFDENYFMYGEEVDFCYRLKKKGARVFYTPQTKVVHLKGGSSNQEFESAVIGEFKGLVSFFKKHRSLWQAVLLKLVLKGGSLLRIGIFGIIDKRKRVAYEKALQAVK